MNDPRFEDFDYNTPVKDGDHNAHLVKYFVDKAEKQYEIPHRLGRIPTRCQVVKSDTIMLMEVESMDRDRALITFFENQSNIILRFE